MKKYFIATLWLSLLLTACSGAAPDETAAPETEGVTPNIEVEVIEPVALISEVQTGAVGNNNLEFIELYNAGNAAPIDLKGWSVWYMLTDGQDEDLVYRWSEHALIPPGGHYLMGRAGEDLSVVPDAVFEQPMVHPKGSLQLRATDGTVMDSLAWGSGPAAFAEGVLALAMENGVSLERFPGGEAGNMTDSDDNSDDFSLNASPNPQNSGSAVTPVGSDVLISVDAPDLALPGSAYDYIISVVNQTPHDLNDLTVQFPILLDLEIVQMAADVQIQEQAAYWDLAHLSKTHQVALWGIETLAAGETASTTITVQTPWTYFTALAANYSVQGADGSALAFGGPVYTAVEGGTIPIGTARTILNQELSIEGIATMHTGGLYAGTGNTKIYIADETGGIQVWIPGGEGQVTIPLGTRVRVFGANEMYRGAVEFVANTPQDVEVIEVASAQSLWPPNLATVSEAVLDTTLPGLLTQIEGLVTRVEEFTYSYELDLMDQDGETLTLYVDKQTNISVEIIEVGQQYRATGILETNILKQQLYPRIQADLERIYPPVMLLELDAPITVVNGEPFDVSLTVFNHTSEPMTNVVVSAPIPQFDFQVDLIHADGVKDGYSITWMIPELSPNGASVEVGYQAQVNTSQESLALPTAQAVAVEWTDPAESVEHHLFLGGLAPIWAIQGPGFRSPYILNTVKTSGIVTGVFPELGGFWIQESHTDSDPLTSAGLFIGTEGVEVVLTPGDEVEVSGLVREASQQTQLQITNPDDIVLRSQGNPLPNAVELDPPASVEESWAYYEAIEGMFVQVSGPALAVAPTTKYGEYSIVLPYHEVARLWQGDTANNGLTIMVDDGSSAVHADRSTLAYVVNASDYVSGLIGPLAYTFGQYKVEPVTVPQIEVGALELPTLAFTTDDEFSIMTWNVENLFDTRAPHPSSPEPPSGSEYKTQIAKVANTILAAGTPTIVGLQEVENIDILADIAAHEALTGFGYVVALVEGTDSRGIDNGYLVRSDVAAIVNVEQHVAPEGLTSRPPLLIEVDIQTSTGVVTVFVANNHFTSMSAGVEATEPRRNAQAAWNVTVLEMVLAKNPDAYVAIIGDLNSFYNTLPIDTLRAAGLQHVFEILPEDARYTYIFQGASQTLDHILVTASLFDFLLRTEVLHVNADYAPPMPGDESPMRKSDHDPVVATFTP